MLRKLIISLSLMTLAVALGLGFASYLIRTKPPPVRRSLETPATRVEVFRVEGKTVEETFIGYGTARPDRITTISAQVGGNIIEVAKGLEDGSAVKKGQPLIRIEEADYRHQLDRATHLIRAEEAALKQIGLERANLDKLIKSTKQDVQIVENERLRVSRLFEKKLAASREFDLVRSTLLRANRELSNLETRLAVLDPRKEQALASIAAHKAEVALAKLSLDRCRIVAPFDGRVKQRLVEVGDTVRPSQPLLIALKLDRIEVPIELPAACASKVAVGNRCTLSVESIPTLQWSGQLERIGPAADERSRTITAYVMVDNTRQPTPLVPGSFVRAEIAGPLHADAIVVPRGSLRDGAVFVVEDGLALKRPVELTCSLRDVVVVRSGLKVGDNVIVTNLASLQDRMPVTVKAREDLLANNRPKPSATSRNTGGSH